MCGCCTELPTLDSQQGTSEQEVYQHQVDVYGGGQVGAKQRWVFQVMPRCAVFEIYQERGVKKEPRLQQVLRKGAYKIPALKTFDQLAASTGQQ